MQPDHPAFSLRRLLTGTESSISDTQLELAYSAFAETVVSCSTEVAFRIVFQLIRTIYRDLAQTVEREQSQLQLTLANQIQLLTEQLGHQRDHSEALTRQLNQQHEQYEIRMAELRADRADAIEKDKQNTLVLHSHLLHIPRLAIPVLRGSATRAESWRVAKRENTFLQRRLPTVPASVDAMRTVARPEIERILTTRYAHETDIYPDFLAVLSRSLAGLASFHDTSNNPFLRGQKPDLTLAAPGAVKVESDLVRAVIEVKKIDTKTIGSDEDLGQVYDYLVNMHLEQSGRRILTAILSNVRHNIVVSLEVTVAGWTIVQHSDSNIYETLAYLHDTALVELCHLPPSLGFVYPHTYMRRRLGNPQHSVVGEFPIHGQPGQVMAIKRYANAASEISYLRAFAAIESRPASIPSLCYVAPDESEFGITPVGTPLIPGAFANHFQAQTLLIDVLDALVWLHSLGIVHRDVRCDNVVVTGSGHGVLIDFDAACDFRRASARPWRGGYICCPYSHVRDVIAHGSKWSSTLYCPSPSDDWHAWVLLANCLMFPTAFAGFQSQLVGSTCNESRRLLGLWDALIASTVWGPFVAAARDLDIDKLRKLPEMFVWL